MPRSPRKMVAAGVSPARKLQRAQRLTNTELQQMMSVVPQPDSQEKKIDLESSRPKSGRFSVLLPHQPDVQNTATYARALCALRPFASPTCRGGFAMLIVGLAVVVVARTLFWV
jgi:hypothetical protein